MITNLFLGFSHIFAGMELSNLHGIEATFCQNDSQCQYLENICKLISQVPYCDPTYHICNCENLDLNISDKNNDSRKLVG